VPCDARLEHRLELTAEGEGGAEVLRIQVY
jgi:hypothetical protein